MENIARRLRVDEKLVAEFFFVFAKSEYALKASEFLQESTHASPDWLAFAKEIRPDFDENKSKELKEAVDYLKSKPPKKQVTVDGHLEWDAAALDDNVPMTQYLVTMICRVRNNLFHGGKFAHDDSEEIGRDEKLIESAATVLIELMQLNDQVKYYFYQRL